MLLYLILAALGKMRPLFTTLFLCIAVISNKLHWMLSPPDFAKSNQKYSSDWETKYEGRKLGGKEGHQAFNIPHYCTALSPSRAHAGWGQQDNRQHVHTPLVPCECFFCKDISLVCVPKLHQELCGCCLGHLGSNHTLAPWICCAEGDKMLNDKAYPCRCIAPGMMVQRTAVVLLTLVLPCTQASAYH